MVALETPICNFGWKAPDFSLKGIDEKNYKFSDIKGKNGTLVMFICNHCPYVKSVIGRIVEDCQILQENGIGIIAIMSNDVNDYPEDSFENMKKVSDQFNYPFPYLLDETQQVAKAYGAVLLLGIGDKLSDGKAHDLRAPDYDDWTTKDEKGRAGINADLLVWDDLRGKSLEISSMGVRVDEEALAHQLLITGQEQRTKLPFHTALLKGKLPYTIGGGIGQSRVVMFVTKKEEISSVQPIFEAY